MKKKHLLTLLTISISLGYLSAQNIGIGTASPQLKLDVNGDIYLRGDDIYMSNDAATNSNNDYMNYNDISPPNLGGAGVFSFHADAVRGQAWDSPTASITAKGGYFRGRVGIGTTTPQSITHISGGASGDVVLKLETDLNNTGSEDDNPRVEFYQDGGVIRAMMGFYDGSNNAGNIFRIGAFASNVEDWTTFTINTVTQNIGMGTATPSERLELLGGGIKINGLYGIGFVGEIPYNGNVSSDRAKIYYDINYAGTNQDFLVIEKTDGNDLNPDGGIAFTTKGMDNIRNTALTIRGTSRVGIGTVTVPVYALELANSTTIGLGRARANAWITYSDGRIKNNRKPLSYGLNTLMALQPLEYQQHDSGHDKNANLEIYPTMTSELGFIAQDLQKVIPEIVHQPEDEQKDLWSVDYIRLVPVLTKAIQEQETSIQKLEKICTSLEAQLADLKSKK